MIYLARGDFVNAGLSAAAMIPFAGWGATGGKFVNKAIKYGDDVVALGKKAIKYGDDAVALGKKALQYGDEVLQAGGKLLNKAGSSAKKFLGAAGDKVGTLFRKNVDEASTTIINQTKKADFYVKPNGDVVPATGYRYMDSQYAENTMETMQAPGSYFGFEKLDKSSEVRDLYQISDEWSDAKLRGEFDTLQVIDDIIVPSTRGNKTNVLEPFASSYPEFGNGGGVQLLTDKTIKFNDVTIIRD